MRYYFQNNNDDYQIFILLLLVQRTKKFKHDFESIIHFIGTHEAALYNVKRMALGLDFDSTSAQQLRQTTSLCLSFFISEMEIILPISWEHCEDSV